MGRTTTITPTLFFLTSLFYVSVICAEDFVDIKVLSKPEKCGKPAENGDTISMRYKGNLYDVTSKVVGKQFDSNFDSPSTFDFKLGAGQVIQGWEKGVPGMCVGEKRRLTIPPSLAYGDGGFTDLIPPKSTLQFEIELVALNQGNEQPIHHDTKADTFVAMDTNDDKEISREEMAGFIKKFNDEGAEEDRLENIEAIVGEIFQEDDKNKDGVISLEEYQRMQEGPDEHKDEL